MAARCAAQLLTKAVASTTGQLAGFSGRTAGSAGGQAQSGIRLFTDAASASRCATCDARSTLQRRAINMGPATARRRMCTSAEESAKKSTAPPAQRSAGISWAAAGGILLAGLGSYAYVQTSVMKKKRETLASLETSVGEAQVGGPFTLTDTAGKKFESAQLHGEFAILYFGFTHCPDICPDELEKMAAALDLVEKRAGIRVQPVFITVDPERDTAKQIQSYIKEFHPRMIGLRGTMEEVKKAAKLFRVYFMKTNDSKDYLVDHSIIMYLLNPEGKFVTFYGKSFTAEEIASNLVQHARAWKDKHPDYKLRL